MKYVRIPIALLAASLLLANCKSSDPEFGIPDDPKKGFGKKLFDGERMSYSEMRYKWKVNERAKSKAMFERMQDEY